MARFLPALLVLILIFGVHPLQFVLILAVVILGLVSCYLHLCPTRCETPRCGECGNWLPRCKQSREDVVREV